MHTIELYNSKSCMEHCYFKLLIIKIIIDLHREEIKELKTIVDDKSNGWMAFTRKQHQRNSYLA